MSKLTCSIFITYLLLGIYVLVIAIQTPFIGILVDTANGQPVIVKSYYTDWAQQQNIEKGDILLTIDGQLAEEKIMEGKPHIFRSAKELSIKKANGVIHSIKIKHTDIPEELFVHIVFPLLYFLLSFGVAIFLWKRPKENQITNLLTLFLLTCSLAYTSIGASSRGDIIGKMVIGYCIVFCLVLFIHFLQHYFYYLHIKWPSFHSKWLYLLPILLTCCYLMEFVDSRFNQITPIVILGLFGILVLYALAILITSYIRTQSVKIRLIAIALIIPFLPFLLLFVVPEILHYPPILPAEFTALFLLFIPFSFIFIQVNERLFDIEYQLSRFRYYCALAFFSALILTLGISIFLVEQLSFTLLTAIFALIFLVNLASFYVKEQLDFKHRKVIFSSNGDYVHNLYAAVNRMGKAKNQQELLARFTYEITEKLGTTAFSIETISQHVPLSRGEINTRNQTTQLLLYDTADEKIVLLISHTLQKEELLWLELLALYVSMFMDSLKLIEDLVLDIQHMKVTNETQLPWLDKLLWNIIEKEKSILAQELHDTILQEQLHLARELDVLAGSSTIQGEKVRAIREQLLNATKDLREYCENLSPPLLDTFGLQIALKKLVQKVNIRANFLLSTQIERVHFQDLSLHLVVYRLVQELLNNAIKHAEATEVSLRLVAIEHGFELHYDDNGIGCDIEDLMKSSASMGINGIRERVRAFNGHISITSKPNEGMHINIKIQEEGEKIND
ncbi:sensor histidine kinase [Lysinibacillus parviboronicapiens]|uniref:sensor histidine kinase n=1 Tax=Lysinibacillus parviboronicapiens TaxID=436516 RepID=UPI000D35332D|nr:ATP-binding protein [Lysinibacillus parviboronicapiens]